MFSQFLIFGLGLESQTDAAVSLSDKTYISITFAQKTYRYKSAETSTFTRQGANQLWYINLGAKSDHFLSIAVSGNRQGIFPFGNKASLFPGISLITYGRDQAVYSSCPAHHDLSLQAQGAVHIEAQETSKLAKGRFTGFLLSSNCLHQMSQLVPISGQFWLRR
ncbi:hypothetical protein [Tellurirhabdus bombi]|uniref:hypothetical protein n=1 Tax=Tellurirhabdus bombi TaxID=2907205 RepID=UPI001F45D9EF|nr:hypothetical protein [Tellurirhabdus bombi]